MTVGVVGAGVAGLAAARALSVGGAQVVVFEKSAGPGGRVATRRIGAYTFDSGATSIAPRGMAIEHAMLSELSTTELVRIEKPIYVHQSLRVSAGDAVKNSVPRYAYTSGNNLLGKMLADGVDVRYNTQVDAIEKDGSGFSVRGQSFEALVLTPPIPQTSALLWTLGESRAVANARYRACLSLMLGFEEGIPATPYHALLEPEQRHPLTFLAIETEKVSGRAPAGGAALVAQMSPEYSRESYDKPDADLISECMIFIRRLFGDRVPDPAVAQVKKWKYSHPESVALFDSVNRPGDKILIAGDGVMAGRTESAFESGVRAARLLLQSP